MRTLKENLDRFTPSKTNKKLITEAMNPAVKEYLAEMWEYFDTHA